jgi:hypothetical protein
LQDEAFDDDEAATHAMSAGHAIDTAARWLAAARWPLNEFSLCVRACAYSRARVVRSGGQQSREGWWMKNTQRSTVIKVVLNKCSNLGLDGKIHRL